MLNVRNIWRPNTRYLFDDLKKNKYSIRKKNENPCEGWHILSYAQCKFKCQSFIRPLAL